MSNHKDIVSLIKKLSGQSNLISVPRVFIEITGSLDAATVLSQSVYWSDKGDKDGWFYKSVREWTEEIGIKRTSLETACSTLEDMGFIKTQVKAAGKDHVPTKHFKVDMPFLAAYVYEHCGEHLQDSTNAKEEHLQKTAGSFVDFSISSIALNYIIKLLISLENEDSTPKGKRSKTQKDETLKIAYTPKGGQMLQVISVAYEEKGRSAPEYFKNSIQRDAYLKVFDSLNGELPELTRKAVARDITSLDRLLSWLESCVKNKSKVAGRLVGALESTGNPMLDAIAAAQKDPNYGKQ